ncbi:hypothetical protein ABZ468_42945 [Streptomyces sp. NPDC005708]|uniref:hypothetical protein n=1 Tax=Streptomyces sp. NPDC005708 TaxID=3154564 RepID=UPI0033E4378E
MGDLGIALIAAGSALAGSALTGWFTVAAGRRQAEAARHAGDRQADAVLDTVRATLDEQRAVQILDARRKAYADFLEAVEARVNGVNAWNGETDRAAIRRTLGVIQLEGPDDVYEWAFGLGQAAMRHRSGDELGDLDVARARFLVVAQRALSRGNL